jgi:hypothetical protein
VARRAVKAHSDAITRLDRQQQLVPLLAYCLKDLELSGPTGSWLQQLLGLRLLPLVDEASLARFEALTGPGAPQQLVFVVTEPLEQALVHTQRA